MMDKIQKIVFMIMVIGGIGAIVSLLSVVVLAATVSSQSYVEWISNIPFFFVLVFMAGFLGSLSMLFSETGQAAGANGQVQSD